MTESPEDYELFHYGVKGMKWGVRRDSRIASAIVSRREASRNTKRQMKIYGPKTWDQQFGGMTEEKYKSLSNKKVSIDNNSTYRRISSNKNEKNSGSRYASYLDSDAQTYRATIPMNQSGKKMYEYSYKAAKTLHGPSEKERFEMFKELLDTPSVAGKNGKMVTGKEYLASIGYKRDVKNLDTTALGMKHYYNAFYDKEPLNVAMKSSAVKRGYDVLSDDLDRGLLSNEPVIILNPDTSLKTMSVTRLSSSELIDARKAFKVPD